MYIMYTKTSTYACPDHVEKVDHTSHERERYASIPQEAREFPPLGHFSHFFLILRGALEGFYEWDVG
jgi:hypothetical protein